GHPADIAIDMRLFEQCHADAEDDPADRLAARGLGVEDAARGKRTDIAADPDLASQRVDPHLGKLRAEGVHREMLLLVPRSGRAGDFEPVEAVPGEKSRDVDPQMRRL